MAGCVMHAKHLGHDVQGGKSMAEAGQSLRTHLAALHRCWEEDGACADPQVLQRLLESLAWLQQSR